MTATTTRKPTKAASPTPAAAPPTHLNIKYIGRFLPHIDPLYKTGRYDYSTVRAVPLVIAQRMLRHADSYVQAEPDELATDIFDPKMESPAETAKRIDEAAMQEARDHVEGLNREMLSEYARVYYGQKIDGRLSDAHAKQAVNQLIDRFGAM